MCDSKTRGLRETYTSVHQLPAQVSLSYNCCHLQDLISWTSSVTLVPKDFTFTSSSKDFMTWARAVKTCCFSEVTRLHNSAIRRASSALVAVSFGWSSRLATSELAGSFGVGSCQPALEFFLSLLLSTSIGWQNRRQRFNATTRKRFQFSFILQNIAARQPGLSGHLSSWPSDKGSRRSWPSIRSTI
jgi:hypothetical protein